jgi:AcrR family transcriptional regulator
MRQTKKRASREPLSKERIELAALDLIEEVGYQIFSTRQLAARCGYRPMSIYHYFPSVAHLRDALLDRWLKGFEPPGSSLPWQDRLRSLSWAIRAAALGHPSFFQAIALHRMNTPEGLSKLEQAVTIFRDAGFDAEMTARLFRVWGYYVFGAALAEAGGYAKGPSAVDPLPDEVAERRFPVITAVNPYFRPQHREETFKLGLELMLDGFQGQLSRLSFEAQPKTVRRRPSSSKSQLTRT